MALYTPILNEFERSFDVSVEDVVITFSYLVKENDTTLPFSHLNVVVETYDKKGAENGTQLYDNSYEINNITSLGNTLVLPRSLFTNGEKYLIKIRALNKVYGEYGELSDIQCSEFSARKVLKCYKCASISTKVDCCYYNDTTKYNTIGTLYCSLIGAYVKDDVGDGIKSYRYNLYEKIEEEYQLVQSGKEVRTTKENNLLYRFIDLKDKTYYKVQMICTSQSNYVAYSEFVFFYTNWISYYNKNLLSISSDENFGDVTMTTKFLQYLATSDGEIIYNDKHEIDATNGNYHIIYQKGLDELNDKYTIQIWVRNPMECERIMCVGVKDDNENNEMYVKYFDRHFHLFITSHNISSHYTSEEIFDDDYILKENDQLYLYIKYSGNLQNISMQVGINKSE